MGGRVQELQQLQRSPANARWGHPRTLLNSSIWISRQSCQGSLLRRIEAAQRPRATICDHVILSSAWFVYFCRRILVCLLAVDGEMAWFEWLILPPACTHHEYLFHEFLKIIWLLNRSEPCQERFLQKFPLIDWLTEKF